MNEQKDDLAVKAICIAVQGYALAEGDIKTMLTGSIQWLYEQYQRTNDIKSIHAAKIIIEAYKQLGFLPADNVVLFKKIYEEIGVVFEEKYYAEVKKNTVKPNLTQIRRILGKWPKAYQKKDSSEWAARDILEHIEEKKYGTYIYQCQKIDQIFELLIMEDGTYLIDATKGKIYVIAEK